MPGVRQEDSGNIGIIRLPAEGRPPYFRKVTMLLIVRIIHSFFAITFLGGIVFLYYCILTGKPSRWLLPVTVVLLVEGVILFLNNGKCPLEPLHLKYGDDKGFFGMFLPEKALPYVLPVLFTVTILGFLLLVRFV